MCENPEPTYKTLMITIKVMYCSPQAAQHQVEGVLFKGQKLLVSENVMSRDLSLSSLFLKRHKTHLDQHHVSVQTTSAPISNDCFKSITDAK